MPLTRVSRKVLAELEVDVEWVEGIFDRIACGDSPVEIAREYGMTFGVFGRWLEGSEERRDAYAVAKRIASEAGIYEAREIVDGDGEVARDKLRYEDRWRRAKYWDPDRYGDRDAKPVAGSLVINITGLRDEKSVVIEQVEDTLALDSESPI